MNTQSRFQEQVQRRSQHLNSALCVGLDPVPEKLPAGLPGDTAGILTFCLDLVEATADYAVCYKPNSAFFEVFGPEGLEALREVIAACQAQEVPVINDAKRGDIGSTAERYAAAVFRAMNADAVTINAYLGFDGVKPFRDYSDRTSFILCYTSNPSRVDLQTIADAAGKPLYLRLAQLIAQWNETGNLGAVVGATAPEELAEIRKVLGDETPILCPGVGAQGGDLEATLKAGAWDPSKGNLLINASRSIIYASSGSDYAKAARKAAMEMHEAMKAFNG